MNDFTRSGQQMSDLLPHAAQVLRTFGVELVRIEYSRGEIFLMAFGGRETNLSPDQVALVCLEIVKQFTLLLRQRYPSHGNSDGSTGFFEWHPQTDILKHEHTLVRHGL